MRRILASACMIVACFSLFGYEITTSRSAVDANGLVKVDVKLDAPAGLAFVNVQLAYDTEILSVKSVSSGTLLTVFGDTFVYVVTNGVVSVSIFSETGDDMTSTDPGTLATIMFEVRPGVSEAFTDIPIVDVQIGEKSGVRDVASSLTVANPVSSLEATSADEQTKQKANLLLDEWNASYPGFMKLYGPYATNSVNVGTSPIVVDARRSKPLVLKSDESLAIPKDVELLVPSLIVNGVRVGDATYDKSSPQVSGFLTGDGVLTVMRIGTRIFFR